MPEIKRKRLDDEVRRKEEFDEAMKRMAKINFRGQKVNVNDEGAYVLNDENPLNKLLNQIARKFRNGDGGQILDTIGVELESLGLTQVEVSQILQTIPYGVSGAFKVTRDGSAEMKAHDAAFKGRLLRINSHTEPAAIFANNRLQTLGYEAVSIPLDIMLFELTIRNVLPRLKAAGDFISDRCSTHFHIGFPQNLRMMKVALRLGLYADDLFYSIAGMSKNRRFRGHSNNAIYARPLANGPYFRSDGGYYQTLNWELALEAESVQEFFIAYALNIRENHPKYHPARYFALNLYSIILHETLEFRYFNQTFEPGITVAAAKLCQLFTEICMKATMDMVEKLPIADVFSTESFSYYKNKLYTLLEMGSQLDCYYSLNSEDISELLDVISGYKGIGIPNVPVLTHCKDGVADFPERILSKFKKSREKPIPDGHIDIHNIEQFSIMLEE